MKLFLFIIVAILFIACSQDPANENAGDDTANKDNPTEVTGEPELTNEDDPADSDLTPIAEEDPTEENTDTPAVVEADMTDPEGSVPSEEIFITSPVSSPAEDTVPLNATEDERLVAQINGRYNDYVELQLVWEDYAPQLEILQDQATNQEFLNPLRVIQSHMKNVPVTPSQIEDIEENLEEGIFISNEDRGHAETAYQKLNTFVYLLETSLNLSLEYAKLAEEDPSILYAETTTDEENEIPEQVVEPFEPENTTDAVATTDTAVEIQEKTMPEPLIIQPINGSTPENIIAGTEKDCDNDLDMVCSTMEDSAVADASTDKTDETSEDTEDTHTDEEIDPTDEENPSGKTAGEIAGASTDDKADSDIAGVQSEEKNEETSFTEDVVAWWGGIVQWFDEKVISARSSLNEWVLEPTALNIPNTNTPEEETVEAETTEEEEVSSNSSVEAHQLLDGLLQNVNQFAQANNVQSVESLVPHITEISNIPEAERTAEQSALFNKVKQVAQGVDQMADGSATDFLKLSNYSSNDLPETEITMIVEILSDVVKTSEAQQD